MKKFKKTVAIFLTVVMLLSCISVSAVALDKKDYVTDYPYIFVPGMVGWGEDWPHYNLFPYWGGGFVLGQTDNLVKYLRDNGIYAYAANPSPFGSAWDRACEIYAALTGSVVDYGEAHANEHNHDRFGVSYEGRPLMGKKWDINTKINLIGYSFGGETVRMLSSLMAFGSEKERAATGDGTSELFKGGHDSIHSCVTLSSPHNGTPVANIFVDSDIPLFLITFVVHFICSAFGGQLGPLSFHLGHFGIGPKQNEERAKFDLRKVINFVKAKDNSGAEMSMSGAKALNEKIRLAPNTYYYSYSSISTEFSLEDGKQIIMENTNPLFNISSEMIAKMEGMIIDGIEIIGDWVVNDGIVPIASSKYPMTDKDTALSYEKAIKNSEKIESGRWYYMEPIISMDHFDFTGITDYPTSMEEFYLGIIDVVNSR